MNNQPKPQQVTITDLDKFTNHLKQTAEKVEEDKQDHLDYSYMLGNFSLTFGYLAALIAFLAGSVSAAQIHILKIDPKVLATILAVISGVVTTTITAYNFSQRSEKHRVSSVQYSALGRLIEEHLLFPPQNQEEAEKILTEINGRLDEIEKHIEIIFSKSIIGLSRRKNKGSK